MKPSPPAGRPSPDSQSSRTRPARTTGVAVLFHAPGPGAVKPELVRHLGEERAARFHLECAMLVIAKALRLEDAEVSIFFAPAAGIAEVQAAVMRRFDRLDGRFVAQRGSSTGDRIHHALSELAEAGFSRQITLATTSPTTPASFLQRAAAALERHDCVIGPTWTGGYYLIGTRRPDLRLFDGANWGSGLEFGQTFDNLTRLGLNCAQLPRWQGSDSPDDLPFLRGQVRDADYARLKSILDETG